MNSLYPTFSYAFVLLLSLVLISASNNINGKEGSPHHPCDEDDETCLLSDHRPSTTESQSSLPQWNPRAFHPCNIRQITWQQLLEEFGPSGLPPMYPHPLVIVLADATMNRNQIFQEMSRKDRILDSFPLNFTVTLSSSNSFSEHRRKIPFSQYLDELKEYPQHQQEQPAQSSTTSSSTTTTTTNRLSNETWYLFGETYSPEWKIFLEHYELPLCEACVPGENVALSFGIGNCGSGVQWHVHGPGFSEAVIGKKHWILFQDKPDFHKDQTSLNWMEHNYMNMEPKDRPFECTLDPGDIIYFPNMWWHATINLDDYTAFVSTFTQEHLFV